MIGNFYYLLVLETTGAQSTQRKASTLLSVNYVVDFPCDEPLLQNKLKSLTDKIKPINLYNGQSKHYVRLKTGLAY
jgi:hypothetical protein